MSEPSMTEQSMTQAAGRPRAAIVVLAAGAGSRVGADRNKVLLELDGVPVLVRSVLNALEVDGVYRLIVVIREEDREAVTAALAPRLGTHDVWIVTGGAERHDSEARAIAALAPDIRSGEIDVVAIHDAARPLASPTLFARVIAQATRERGAVPAVTSPPVLTATGADAGDLFAVQTPQAFPARPLLAAYQAAAEAGFTGTDTAACLAEFTDLTITAVPGERTNIKVTFPEDVALATELLRVTHADWRG